MESLSLITGFLTGGATYLFAFVIVLGAVITVHEFGHFIVGRWCGARIEAFSIGFGPSIAKWTDRRGTVWKVCWIPLGGYVMFWGDANAASMTHKEKLAAIKDDPTAAECMHFKPVWQRALITIAGPAINFLFGIAIFATIFALWGYPKDEPRVGSTLPGGAAEAAGVLPGDLILSIDGAAIEDFVQLKMAVQSSDGVPVHIRIQRDGKTVDLTATPTAKIGDDGLGGHPKEYQLGISSPPSTNRPLVKLGPVEAVEKASGQVYFIVERTVAFLGGLIAGREDPSQLSGPIGIGDKAGKAIQLGWLTLFGLIAGVSVSVGLANLFPIPMLDGGHLVFYAYEAVFRRPLGERAQEYGLRIGVALVLSVMLFATWNDLTRIFGS